MAKDDTLLFLQNKIQEIKFAMFRAEMNTELPLPNNIISTIKTDSDGNIWFFTSCNGAYAQYLEKHFFAYLDYYQKGLDCRLRLNGKASIVEEGYNANETSTGSENSSGTDIVLIKFKILHAEYFENKPISVNSVKDKVKTFFTDIFIPHSHRVYDFT